MRLFSHCARGLAALIVLVSGATALAGPDTYFLGNGDDGPLAVSTNGVEVNDYTRLTVSAAVGETKVRVLSASAFEPDDLLMLYQAGGHPEVVSKGPMEPSTLDIRGTEVGRFELARITSVNGDELVLDAPLVRSWKVEHVQVIRIPEFTMVKVALNSSITARPWDGSTGGVLAFLARDGIENQGTIGASFAGFRGGEFQNNANNVGEKPPGCTALDELPPLGGRKGEGIATGRFLPNVGGYGFVANAGGGGDCHNAGGGGGGNGRPGGRGGRTGDSTGADPGGRDYGGVGGAALDYPSLIDRLTLGGGGGAGQGNNANGNPGQRGSSGGRGGGVVFIRAHEVSGAGTITSDGQTAVATLSDGGGGGGAGGSVYLRVSGNVNCSAITARGGGGGSDTTTTEPHGPGGGGGAGRILVQAATVTSGCQLQATPGIAGTTFNTSLGPSYGATPVKADESHPALQGKIETPPGPLVEPAAPVMVEPVGGSMLTQLRPRISGTAGVDVGLVHVFLDGTRLEAVPVDGSGAFSISPPTSLSLGEHVVMAAAEQDGLWSKPAVPVTFSVVFPPVATRLGPVARLTPMEQTIEPGSTATLDASGSIPGTGQVLARWKWEAIEGPTGPSLSEGPVQTLVLSEPGLYRFRLVVEDASGARSVPVEARVRVSGEVHVPDAALGCGCGASGGAWGLLAVAALGLVDYRRSSWSNGAPR